MSAKVSTGLERIARGDPAVVSSLRGLRLGLCAHPASVDSQLRHARFVLEAQGLTLSALFGPEHGYGGEAQDLIAVDDERGGQSTTAPALRGGQSTTAPALRGGQSTTAPALRGGADLPVYSLYGATEAALSPSPQQLAGLDAIVIDLQDVGARYYTFVWTAVLILRAAAKAGVRCVVLDRPNPLGGEIVEGGPQRSGYRSFVGLCDVAVRHGMTIGELCHMVALEESLQNYLQVVTMLGYQRPMDYADTGLPWVLPSPNMPTFETALVYPGGCLIEGTNLSEGRGTTRPFEIWGAPTLDAAGIAARVPAPGAHLRPISFAPTFQKHAGKRCFGLQVHVLDRAQLRSYALYLRLIAQAYRASAGQFAWRTTTYEFVSDRPAIDLLSGGPEFRTLVDADRDIEAWLADDDANAQAFALRRQAWLLY